MSTPADVPANDPDLSNPHKPADDREEIYFDGCPAFRAELAHGWYWVLLGLIFVAGPIVFKVLWTPDMVWWIIPIGLVIGIIFILIPWLQTKTLRYKVSNYRIDFERGLLAKRFDTLELWHVEDIQLKQSLLERLLGVGTITVHSHDDTNPHLLMYGLPNPKPIYESLKQRIIAVKRQRGVIKMDTGSMDPGDGAHGHG